MESKQNSPLKVLEDYSETYASLGDRMLAGTVNDDVPVKVASHLPLNYRMANLGSGNAKYSYLIAAEAQKQGKLG